MRALYLISLLLHPAAVHAAAVVLLCDPNNARSYPQDQQLRWVLLGPAVWLWRRPQAAEDSKLVQVRTVSGRGGRAVSH